MAAATAKRKSKRREGPAYAMMGKDGDYRVRLTRAVEDSMGKSLKQDVSDLYAQLYPANMPRPGLGEFIGHLVDRGLAAVRQEQASH